MEPNQKRLLRAAESIRAHLSRLSSSSTAVSFPEEYWSECLTLTRQLHLAEERGWTNCQTCLSNRLESCVLGCLERLQRLAHELSTMIAKPSLPLTLRTIFNELCALPSEFDGFSIDSAGATVSVTTGRVVLEDIALGPFEIRLHWQRIGEGRCYEVIAIEPNPARESQDVTHPHVRDEHLCEGDGQEAIRRALVAGRLSDFFQIVAQILNTYNGGSAYVSLSDWEGIACSDCGRFVSDDDRSSCERCDNDLCIECLEPCAGCEYRYCHSCTDPCQTCDARLCVSCRRTCDGCDRVCCANCLSENDLCGECQEQENNEDSIDQTEQAAIEVAAAESPPTRDSSPSSESNAATV
jgi:hypothetical protein